MFAQSALSAEEAWVRSDLNADVHQHRLDNFTITLPSCAPTPTPTPTVTVIITPTPTNTSSGCPTSDDFNRSNSTNLGANWTERAGDLEINTNLLRNAGTASDNIATICGTYGNVLVSSQSLP